MRRGSLGLAGKWKGGPTAQQCSAQGEGGSPIFGWTAPVEARRRLEGSCCVGEPRHSADFMSLFAHSSWAPLALPLAHDGGKARCSPGFRLSGFQLFALPALKGGRQWWRAPRPLKQPSLGRSAPLTLWHHAVGICALSGHHGGFTACVAVIDWEAGRHGGGSSMRGQAVMSHAAAAQRRKKHAPKWRTPRVWRENDHPNSPVRG